MRIGKRFTCIYRLFFKKTVHFEISIDNISLSDESDIESISSVGSSCFSSIARSSLSRINSSKFSKASSGMKSYKSGYAYVASSNNSSEASSEIISELKNDEHESLTILMKEVIKDINSNENLIENIKKLISKNI